MMSPERGPSLEDIAGAQSGLEVEIKMRPEAEEEAARLSPPSKAIFEGVARTQAGHDVKINVKPDETVDPAAMAKNEAAELGKAA